jgi:ABC-type phosphate transport system substrate-binding protein
LQPLAEKWAEAYQARHAGLAIAVQGGGSTAGVQAALSGAAQIGLSSRALTASERRDVRAIQVARDGIALVVHPSNPLLDLSLDAVKSIYSGRIKDWQRLEGPVKAITVITREEGSGTRAAFESLVMSKQPRQRPDGVRALRAADRGWADEPHLHHTDGPAYGRLRRGAVRLKCQAKSAFLPNTWTSITAHFTRSKT